MRRMTTMKSWIGVGTTVATLLVVAPAMAEVRVGGVGGANLASLSTDEAGTKLGMLTRWGAGLALEVDVNESLAVTSRPMFVRRGAEIKTIAGLGDVSAQGSGSFARTELDYIELPVLLKYTLPTEGVRPYLIAGPTLGLRRGATVVSKIGSAAEERLDIKDEVKSTDWGLCAGAGVGSQIADSVHIFAEGVYTYGLTNINKNEVDGNTKNRGLQLRAGLTFSVGGR